MALASATKKIAAQPYFKKRAQRNKRLWRSGIYGAGILGSKTV